MNLPEFLRQQKYPGRGIVIGRAGSMAFAAYFLTGRSEGSRNRVFAGTADGIVTRAFDESKLENPSLYVYPPVRKTDAHLIVTNGTQTDTIYENLAEGGTFEDALRQWRYEPDALHTPRISGLVALTENGFEYKLSILKSNSGSLQRFFFEYPEPVNGRGHYIHTYAEKNGEPVAFAGEPTEIEIGGGLEDLTQSIWNSLDTDNKISLYTCVITPNGTVKSKIINKYE